MQALALEKVTARDFAVVLLASFTICLFGHISIPLWFTPIPIATQNIAVLMTGAFLGAKRGAAAVFAFLAQGAMGLPVFANGDGGFHVFLGPRGGYLIGYLIAAFIVGYLIEKKRSPALAFTAANLAIFACGAAYLATFVGFSQAFFLGIAPFLFGDFLKILLCVKVFNWKKKREAAAS